MSHTCGLDHAGHALKETLGQVLPALLTAGGPLAGDGGGELQVGAQPPARDLSFC